MKCGKESGSSPNSRSNVTLSPVFGASTASENFFAICLEISEFAPSLCLSEIAICASPIRPKLL